MKDMAGSGSLSIFYGLNLIPEVQEDREFERPKTNYEP